MEHTWEASSRRLRAPNWPGFFPVPGETPLHTHNLATWDLKTGKLVRMHSVQITAAADLSPDGRTLVSSGVLIHVASGRQIVRLEGAASASTGLPVSFSKDGVLVAATVTKEHKMATAKGHTTWFGPDGIRVWEAATGKTVAHLKTKSWPAQVAFHPNNRYVATNE